MNSNVPIARWCRNYGYCSFDHRDAGAFDELFFRSLPRANEGCQVSMFEDELATYPAAAWIAVG